MLVVIHKMLPQVEQPRIQNQLAEDTLNALPFLTNNITEAIEHFMPLLKQ